MRKRSIPQLRITLNPYFWTSCVHRGYMPRLRISITSFVAICWNDLFNIRICRHLYTYLIVYMWSMNICVYLILSDWYQMLSLSGKGSWWPSSHFCENGVVTIPFSTIFYCWLPVGHFDRSLRNETPIAIMMLST